MVSCPIDLQSQRHARYRGGGGSEQTTPRVAHTVSIPGRSKRPRGGRKGWAWLLGPLRPVSEFQYQLRLQLQLAARADPGPGVAVRGTRTQFLASAPRGWSGHLGE